MNPQYYIWMPLIALGFLSCSSDDSSGTPTGFQNQLDFVKSYGGTKNESANSITSTMDGGYAILGYTQSMDGDILEKDNESFDFWLAKFSASGTLDWSVTYGGSDDDRGRQIIQSNDGGYVILGYTQSNDGDIIENSGLKDFWLAKLDSSGQMQWQKSFGYSGADDGLSIIQTTDSGYLLTGILDVTASGGEGNTSRSSLHAGGDYWVIKLNASGTLEWSKYYGGTFTDTPYDVVEISDGYVIVGSSDSYDVDISENKGSYDFWVIKIGFTGELIWEKTYGGQEIDEAHAIVEAPDGNLWIAGDTRSADQDVSTNLGLADFWLIKISPQGELLSEKTFGGSGFDSGQGIKKTSDGGFLLCGSSRSVNGNLTNNHGQNDAWIFKLDHNASMEWSRSIGGSDIDVFFDVTELNNQHIVAVGETNSSDFDLSENKGFTDVLIVKIK